MFGCLPAQGGRYNCFASQGCPKMYYVVQRWRMQFSQGWSSWRKVRSFLHLSSFPFLATPSEDESRNASGHTLVSSCARRAQRIASV